MKKRIIALVALVLAAALLLSIGMSANAAEEKFKKGMAYLLSGAIVYADSQGTERVFQVMSDTGVYVVRNATSEGADTIKANDMLQVAVAVDGKAKELYVWAYDIQYMSKKQVSNYRPAKGAGVYGVTLGNAEIADAPTPIPVVTRDPSRALATKEPGRITPKTRRTATPAARRGKATPAPKATRKAPATPAPTKTPEPIFPAYIAVQPAQASGPIGAPVSIRIIAENVKKYQWQFKEAENDWMNLPNNDTYTGSQASELKFVVTEENAVWKFRCVINGAENTLNSEEVGVTLTTALNILAQPADAVAAVGSEAVFEVKAVNAAKWAWQEETGDDVWTDVSAYTVEQVDGYTSQLRLTAADNLKGKKFRCHLTGIDGDVLFTESASLITGAAAQIIKQPENVTAANGGKAVLHVEAENAISYQWQYDDGISGWWDLVERDDRVGTMTDTLTLSVRPSVTEFKYRCVITGAENTIETKAVTVKIK